MSRDDPTFSDRFVDLAARGLLGLARVLPYRRRIPFFGWVFARVVAPLAGWDRRVKDNLALIYPGMDPTEVRRLSRQVPANFGRCIGEMYSGPEFRAHVAGTPLTGAGVAALAEARAAGRPVLLITGHFGNYDAPRAALSSMGYPLGGLYNPMSNPLFNAHYVEALASVAAPVFERSRRGMARMVRFLRDGGMVGIVVDQYMRHGVPLDFLGQPAWTALSAAEMALKYDALAIPIYGIRKPDGLTFEILVEPPIPHGDPEVMTQAMNDSLSRQVEAHMDQWLWVHRRWKVPGRRSRKPAA